MAIRLIENARMAVSTLTVNKFRSALTMLGIIIGNASVISMIGIGQGAQSFVLGKLESFGRNRLIVFVSSDNVEGFSDLKPTLVIADAEAIASQAPSVKEVAPQIGSTLLVSYGNRITQTSVTGTTPGCVYVRNTPVARGRFFDLFEQQRNAPVIVLGSDLAKRLFDQEDPIGKVVQINNLSFQVVGVMQSKGSFLGPSEDDVAYIPISTMADQIVGKRSPYGIPVDYIEVSAKDNQSIRAAAFQVANLLTQRHGKKDFTVVANKSFQTLVNQLADVASFTLAAVASISLIVGGIGIMNIMLVSVTERTQEIGLRKAVGATQEDILVQFLVEAIVLSIAGGVIGILIGAGGMAIIGILTPLKPTISLSAISLSVSLSSGVGLFFGIVPAKKAAKLDPIDALRSS